MVKLIFFDRAGGQPHPEQVNTLFYCPSFYTCRYPHRLAPLQEVMAVMSDNVDRLYKYHDFVDQVSSSTKKQITLQLVNTHESEPVDFKAGDNLKTILSNPWIDTTFCATKMSNIVKQTPKLKSCKA